MKHLDEYDKYYEVCYRAAKLGGEVLMTHLGKVEAHLKGRADLVTEADLAAQRTITSHIAQHFPTHRIVGEEDTASKPPDRPARTDEEHVWYIDPLDGTTNYVHQVPHFSVSVALSVGGKPVVGVVWNPVRQECFSAIAGRGAWLEDPNLFPAGRKELHTSKTPRLEDSLVAIGLPSNATPECADLRMFLAAVPECQAIRRTGSAALNLSYVAAGRFDAAWSFSTNPWDVAAGVLLIREAGGAVCAVDGGELILPEGRLLAAANAPLLEEVHALAARIGLP